MVSNAFKWSMSERRNWQDKQETESQNYWATIQFENEWASEVWLCLPKQEICFKWFIAA